jgi:hypothetical protein
VEIYDKELFSLRRRLILALKYQKAYLESVDIEYTGEEYEINVRPSDPFKTGSLDLEGKVSFGKMVDPLSLNTGGFQENLEASFSSLSTNAANPTATAFNTTVETGNITIDVNETKITFMHPTCIETYGIQAAGDMAGLIDSVDTTSAEANIHLPAGEITTTVKQIRQPELKPEITIVSDFDSSVNYIDMPNLQFNLHAQVDTSGIVKTGIALYHKATLEVLNDETLDYWTDMPLNTEFVSKGIPPLYTTAL